MERVIEGPHSLCSDTGSRKVVMGQNKIMISGNLFKLSSCYKARTFISFHINSSAVSCTTPAVTSTVLNLA
jgi:hypothetical protein